MLGGFSFGLCRKHAGELADKPSIAFDSVMSLQPGRGLRTLTDAVGPTGWRPCTQGVV